MKNLLFVGAIMMLALTVSALMFNGHFLELPAVALESGPELVSSNGKPGKTLKAFASKNELDEFLREFAKNAAVRREENFAMSSNSAAPTSDSAAEASKSEMDGQSVTNTQHAGVDEGGIVKLHGNHLIILRRGRLFTVGIGGGSLRPVSVIDAFPPDADPGGTWYDEMLVSANTIAVIGYSYARGGTEIGLFNIDELGNLEYRSTYHLRSNDYYSSRNYASRLIKGKLIFYTPQYLWINPNDPTAQFPAIRKWRKGATDKEFQRIVSATKVYRPVGEINDSYGLALHTVTICDLANGDLECEGTGVIGPAGRVFYVSPTSVYVWTSDWNRRGKERKTRSILYKMPLDGGAPQALGVSGSPVDQFSFLESNDEHLNVLVRSTGGGEAMWRSETSTGDTALLRIPLWSFSDGTRSATNWNYRILPTAEGYTVQNRFVGDYLLYGSGNSWGYQNKKGGSPVYAVRWYTGENFELPLEHSVDRIEALGKDAVVVGTRGSDLYFSPIRLSGQPTVRNGYVRRNAAQGELRSHGFFYKPTGKDTGMLGLPIAEQGRPGYKHLFEGSASVLFLKNESLKLGEIGALASQNTRQANDNCKASCVDWYGNARPLFIRGRILALLGYEIVEGRLTSSGIRETRRTNFSPGKGRYARLGE
ncbi:MAG: beta-propeller domain-containing protein [Acidobacteriota bacterium]|nr:beta-propeller domain-containing protein [Acidobacteriota bacterium]MDH3528078.1 beta-propeller domain-containing protein [Acidobacteriota bacterium]